MSERLKKNLIENLRRAVGIDSIYPNEQGISYFYEELLIDAGFEVER